MSWPRAALFSLSDKRGVVEFARALAAHGTRLLASGGTARHLEGAGIAVTPIESWTRVPEMLGGRVKTLHPHVHGPILARRWEPGDLATLDALGVEPIDLVAVTLYPFEERAPGLDVDAAVEEIDIGGVALLRAAAKNHRDVTVLHTPDQYTEALAAFESGGPAPEQRRAWAIACFARTARYDAAIAADLAARAGGTGPPPVHVLGLERLRGLRYGENPHQPAALYRTLGRAGAVDAAREGRELSYNNLVDVRAAATLAARFEPPACVVVKHDEPCGVAVAATPGEACAQAFAADPLSAFGGIVAFNRPLDGGTAALLAERFLEVVVAPAFEPEARATLEKKKNLRLVALGGEALAAAELWDVRLLGPWALLQGAASGPAPEWRIVTRRAPSPAEREALEFAWTVVSAQRSNAIALARGTRSIGLGSGQTSRVDSVEVALLKAARAGHDPAGAALASDGFFPFADGIERAHQAGITAIVQPGGSVRDAEVIAACDAHGMAMCFTDRRVFRH